MDHTTAAEIESRANAVGACKLSFLFLCTVDGAWRTRRVKWGDIRYSRSPKLLTTASHAVIPMEISDCAA